MKLILLLDYDGTLTSIAKHPRLAVLVKKQRKILKRLTVHPNIKAVIVSGRKLSDVKSMIGIPRFTCVGNHGCEIALAGKRIVHPSARRFAPLLKRIRKELSAKLKIKGVFFEDKEFTLSIHYRLAVKRDLSRFKRFFYEAIRPWKEKVKITTGKKVYEIQPPFDLDKGKAVIFLIRKLGLSKYFPIYIGDDKTDEDAFKVLKEKGITIRVGRCRKSAAKYYVSNIADVYKYLSGIADSSKNLLKYLKRNK